MAAVPETAEGGITMNLSKLETFAIVECVSYDGASVSVNPGTKVTSIVPGWGRMEVTKLDVIDGHLQVSLEDYPFEPQEGAGSLIEVLSLIDNQTRIVIVGDGFTIRGCHEPIKPIVRGFMGYKVDNCFAFQDEDDDGDGSINICLKSTGEKE